MREAQTQLRLYFDGIVERVTDEDIRIRARTGQAIQIRSPRLQIRPPAAVALGFGGAMTLLGGVGAASLFMGSEAADVAGGGSPAATGAPDPASSWIVLALAAGLGFLGLGIRSMRRSPVGVSERGDEDMQTIDKLAMPSAARGDEATKLRNRNRLLAWTVAILAAAVLGLGAWLVAEISSGGTGSLPAEVQEVVDDYRFAWESDDAELFLATTTGDYVFLSNDTEISRESQAAMIGLPGHFAIEVDSTTATGDGPYYAGLAGRVQTITDGRWFDGQWMLKLVEIDGTWKVALHYWIGDI